MLYPKVFISHTNNDPEADAFLKSLLGMLPQNRYDVLVDCEQISTGQNWRDEIYTWIGICNAAVILLSPGVFNTDAVWVGREASILLWRRALDPNFLVIPVYLGGLKPDDMEYGGFRDLHIREVQSIQSADPDTMVDDIVTRLQSIERIKPTPLEDIAAQIETLLTSITESAILRAITELDGELGSWGLSNSIRRRLALLLLQADLKQASAALEILLEHMENERNAGRILALIAPSWVDLCAARWVADCAWQLESKPIALVNAESAFAAEMYVRKASGKPPRTQWPVLPMTSVYGEQAFEDFVQEARLALIRAFRLVADPFDSDINQRLDELLSERNRKGKPVFIVVRYDVNVAYMLPRLQKALPLVSILVLSGPEFPEREEIASLNRCGGARTSGLRFRA